jgi:hypothetical protein
MFYCHIWLPEGIYGYISWYPGSQREMKRDSGRFFMVLKMNCDLLSTDNKVHGDPKDNLNTLAPGRKLYSIHSIVWKQESKIKRSDKVIILNELDYPVPPGYLTSNSSYMNNHHVS